MPPIDRHSSIRFTDEQTLQQVRSAAEQADLSHQETAAIIGNLFDATKLKIESTVDRRSSERGSVEYGTPEWEKLRVLLAQKIVQVIQLLNRTLDLHSNEWKNSPVIWEMLSFDSEILHGANTPLPEALRTAIDRTRGELQGGVDPNQLMEDIDEVIHQTFSRRSAIERVLDMAVVSDISHVPVLQSGKIASGVYMNVRERMRQDLQASDELVAAAARAVCDACQEEKKTPSMAPPFDLGSSEVQRVTGEQAMSSAVGDVYLVRSQNVAGLGDHYIVITGGLVQKPHGLRPQDVSFPIRQGQPTPLDDYRIDEPLVLLKLGDAARQRFYEAYDVPLQFRRQ